MTELTNTRRTLGGCSGAITARFERTAARARGAARKATVPATSAIGPCQAGGTSGRIASAARASASTVLTSSRGAFGTCPHRTEDVPLIGLAQDEGLKPVDDRLRRVLDVVRSLLGALDEDRRERDAAGGVVAPPPDPGGDDRRGRHPRQVPGGRGEGRAAPDE